MSRALSVGPSGGVTRAGIVFFGLFAAVALEVAMVAGPPQYAKYTLAVAFAPVLFVGMLRLPVGVVLALALMGGPLVNYFIQPGNASGIPPESVLLIAFCEAALLVRLIRSGERSALRGVEWLYGAAMLFALVRGGVGGGEPRVMVAESIETLNLVALILILRGLRFGPEDAFTLVLASTAILAPFLLQYLVTEFGVRRVDYYFSQIGLLIPLATWAILNGPRRLRLPLLLSLLLLLVAAFSSGQRGLFMVAVAGSGIAIALYALRGSPVRVLALTIVGSFVVVALVEALPIVQQLAPAPTQRLSEGFGALSYQTRIAEAKDALSAWRGAPAGLGFGASLDVRSEVAFEITGPRLVYVTSTFIHNSYAWYLAKTGVQGLLILVALVGSTLLVAFRGLLVAERARASMAAVVLLAVMAGGAIGGPALHGFYYTPWVAIAVVLAIPMWPTATSPAAISRDLRLDARPRIGLTPVRERRVR